MFLWSAIAHLIALTSPGPDTAIVIRQVSLYGRIEGFKTSLGIGIGIYLHCLLAINGISLIIVSNDLYKFIISIVGGLYILYLGVNMFISKSVPKGDSEIGTKRNNSLLVGLITNVFNVKAFLFFVSLFTILIEDLNNNNLWDTGNYLNRVKPEPVYYFPSELEVRANWDLNETFDLNIKQSVNDSIN